METTIIVFIFATTTISQNIIIMEKLTTIAGPIVEELLKGATIIAAKFDGQDWHVLTKSPKDAEWRFKQWRTLANVNDMNIHLFASWNLSPRTALHQFTNEFFEAKHHFEKFVKPNMAKA